MKLNKLVLLSCLIAASMATAAPDQQQISQKTGLGLFSWLRNSTACTSFPAAQSIKTQAYRFFSRPLFSNPAARSAQVGAATGYFGARAFSFPFLSNIFKKQDNTVTEQEYAKARDLVDDIEHLSDEEKSEQIANLNYHIMHLLDRSENFPFLYDYEWEELRDAKAYTVYLRKSLNTQTQESGILQEEIDKLDSTISQIAQKYGLEITTFENLDKKYTEEFEQMDQYIAKDLEKAISDLYKSPTKENLKEAMLVSSIHCNESAIFYPENKTRVKTGSACLGLYKTIVDHLTQIN